MARTTLKMTALQRLKAAISKDPETGCWNWLGSTNPHPTHTYGTFWLKKLGRSVKAHRLLFQFKYGIIPKGLNACHTCDNTLCVNPDHIFLGTQVDNCRDMREKGRSTKGKPRPYNKGTLNGNCRFTPETINEVRRLKSEEFNFREVSERTGCSETTCRRVWFGETHALAAT